MTDNKTSSSEGIGFFGLLTIVFIVLKLCAVIHWPWLWVLAPLWLPFALGAAVFVALAAVVITVRLVCSLFAKLLRR